MIEGFEWLILMLLVVIIANLQTKQFSKKELAKQKKAKVKFMWWFVGIVLFFI